MFSNRGPDTAWALDSPVNIVFATDQDQLIGLVAAIVSIHRNSRHHRQHRFYVVTDAESHLGLQEALDKFVRPLGTEVTIVEFTPSEFLLNHMRVNRGPRIRRVTNFSRFYLAETLPQIDKIIYLDADVIVTGDIEDLWNAAKLDRQIIACVSAGPHSYDRMGSFYRGHPALAHIDENEEFFNAGVYVTKLREWAHRNVLAEIERWMQLHRQESKGLFELGTQPLLNLVFYRDYEHLGREWNVIGLGDKEPHELDRDLLQRAKLLHWKGPYKPWRADGRFKELWQPYNVVGELASHFT